MHYYIVSESNTSRFDFLVKSLIEGSPRALNSFGFLIASGEFNHMSHNYAVAYQFYKKAAKMGCPIAQGNVGLYLQKGQGIA